MPLEPHIIPQGMVPRFYRMLDLVVPDDETAEHPSQELIDQYCARSQPQDLLRQLLQSEPSAATADEAATIPRRRSRFKGEPAEPIVLEENPVPVSAPGALRLREATPRPRFKGHAVASSPAVEESPVSPVPPKRQKGKGEAVIETPNPATDLEKFLSALKEPPKGMDVLAFREKVKELVELSRPDPEQFRKVKAVLTRYGYNEAGARLRDGRTQTMILPVPAESLVEVPALVPDPAVSSLSVRKSLVSTDSVLFPNLPNLVGPVSPELLEHLRQFPASSVAAKILSNPNYTPAIMVRCQGREVYLSRLLISPDDRKFMLALIQTKTRLEAFFYYASQSGGSWRYSTVVIMGTFFKGSGRSYTQETQPIEDMLFYLQTREHGEAVPLNEGAIDDLFSMGSIGNQTRVFALGQPDKVVYFEHPSLTAVQAHQPGHMFKRDYRREVPSIADLNKSVSELPEGFVPDFSKRPVYKRRFDHQLLGPSQKFTFEANLAGRKIFWDIAVRDEDGLAWVEQIRFSKGEMNRFGGLKEILDTGFLTSKPIEYKSQLNAILRDDESEYYPLLRPTSNDRYMDIREILGQLDFMKAFYASPAYLKFKQQGPGRVGDTVRDLSAFLRGTELDPISSAGNHLAPGGLQTKAQASMPHLMSGAKLYMGMPMSRKGEHLRPSVGFHSVLFRPSFNFGIKAAPLRLWR